MSNFSPGQIWLVNFDPSFGHEYRKVRPAIIIQRKKYIQQSPLLTIVPISSKIDKVHELDVKIKRDAFNRLAVDSVVKVKQISSFDKRRFFKYVGKLKTGDYKSVLTNVKRYLDLN